MAGWARSLYSTAVWAVQPLLRRKLRRRAQTEPGYGVALEERFGYYSPALDSLMPLGSTLLAAPLVWVHAVSLGETRAAAILLQALRVQLPGMRLLLTHSTATGRAEGKKLLQEDDLQVWLPWDTPAAVRRFLHHFHPTVGILIETEVWPNLVAACQQRGVPLVLANARLNAASMQGALRLAPLARPAYAGLRAVWAQTQADAQRLRTVGATVQGVWGNLKFDMQPDSAQMAQGHAWRALQSRPVVLLASSREGEEDLWLHALQQILGQKTALKPVDTALAAINNIANNIQWLIVPRHPQRFEQVQALLQQANLSVSRRSTWGMAPATADVWLGDSMGEMALYYALADVALLGGSFAPLGGQNLIEAAACACPVVLGPHTFNFAEVADQACSAGAAQRVADMHEGLVVALTWAQSASALETARAQALEFAQAHRGAAHATAVAVRELLLQ